MAEKDSTNDEAVGHEVTGGTWKNNSEWISVKGGIKLLQKRIDEKSNSNKNVRVKDRSIRKLCAEEQKKSMDGNHQKALVHRDNPANHVWHHSDALMAGIA